jgi:hypothetical protein
MKLTVDQQKLAASLKKASQDFGDSTDQSVLRWGVSIARELAGATQAFGRGKKAYSTQLGAIISDMQKVVKIAQPSAKVNFPDPQSLIAFVETKRTRQRRRTITLPENKKPTTHYNTFKQAVEIKAEQIGRAKGAWIGAGLNLSSQQKGEGKITIGKNFLGYAQKFARLGDTKKKRSLFSSETILENNSQHSADKTVLSDSQKQKAVKFGLKKTLKWYEKAATKKLK